MEKDAVIFKDIDGKHVIVSVQEVMDAILKGTGLNGMTIPQIIEFETQYKIYGGKLPITEESIREFFENIV